MRQISSDELWVWAILIVTGLVLALVVRSTRPVRRELDRQQQLTRQRFKHVIDPLAGDSYWGSVRPPIYLPIAFLVMGAFALRWFFNPVPGIFLLAWASVLALAVYLDRLTRRRAKTVDDQPPDMVVRWIRVATLFVAGLAILLFIHELMGIALMLAALALVSVTWRDHRRLLAEEARRQEESRAVIRDVGRSAG